MEKTKLELEIKDGKTFINGKEYKEVETKEEMKKWEPIGGDYWIDYCGEVRISEDYFEDLPRLFGNEYKTKEQAEKASKEMRQHNRILAYKMEFCPDYKPDWGDENEKKWYIYTDAIDNEFCCFYSNASIILGSVYFPEKECKELVRKLNSGEVEF